MLNTFFFGYLSLRWRRLVRTLFLLPYIPFSIVVFYKMVVEFNDFGLIFSMIFAPILFATLSWVIKPFATNENKFKSELYTFFFGYLSLKWRRLVRTLLLLTTILFQLSMLGIYIIYSNFDFDPHGIEFLLSLFIPLLIGLFSWIIKPFVVKED
jgi:hypothetical protein